VGTQGFPSYARKSGEEYARNLRIKLQTKQPEINLWQDRTDKYRECTKATPEPLFGVFYFHDIWPDRVVPAHF
jgi:hypothetical protein